MDNAWTLLLLNKSNTSLPWDVYLHDLTNLQIYLLPASLCKNNVTVLPNSIKINCKMLFESVNFTADLHYRKVC